MSQLVPDSTDQRSGICPCHFFHWLFVTKTKGKGSKDGFGVFSALATFALAEGAALTAVAKGEGRDAVVISIYAIIVTLTAVWIRSMLAAEREEMLGTPPQATTVPAFDPPTLRYGRWTLAWTLLLSLIMSVLAYLQLLPNQTRRVAFQGDIDSTTLFVQDKLDQTPDDQSARSRATRALYQWVTWMVDAHSSDSVRRLVWIEADTDFKDYYKPFSAQLDYDRNTYNVAGRVAFIVMPGANQQPPTYRQLGFRLNGKNVTDVFYVVNADPKSYIVVFADIGRKDGIAIGPDDDYRVTITRGK